MKCAEIMTLNPVTCVPDDNVSIAAGIMWDYDCGAVPVVKDMEKKKLVGIITDRDIAMHVVKHAYTHPGEVKVSDCMSTDLATCRIEDPIESAMQLMSERKVRRIPIVDDDGCCMGILSQTDIFAHSEGMEEAVIAMMQEICGKSKDEPSESE